MSIISRTIREQVTDQIRDELVAGQFTAGEALRESELAERFGVSRGPVRDAFLQLAQEGFLAYEANRGVRVRPPLPADQRQLIVSLRQQIEAAIIRQGIESLDEAKLSRIAATLESLKGACQQANVSQIARCDMQFHLTILECCGGEDLLPVWRLLCSQMLLTYTRLENYEQVYQEHELIFENLQAKKKRATLAALKANIR